MLHKFCLALLLLTAPQLAYAQAEEAPIDEAAFEAALVSGPANVPLAEQATLALPAGYIFIPRPQADLLMKRMGNEIDEAFIGLIFSQDQSKRWYVDVTYNASGHVTDTDSSEIDAKGLLQGMKDGARERNPDRVKQGLAPFEVTGWIEPPHYDAVQHKLIWSVEARDISSGNPTGRENSINYNTYALGRVGYVSLNLITGKSTIEADKQDVQQLLAALTFNEGKRYEDFNASTDKVAGYGIAALIGGVAAKKLGLFAMLAVFFAKFAKIFAIAAFAAVAGLRKHFTGKRKAAQIKPPVDPSEPPPNP